MELAVVFIAIAAVWLTFRKWIAREQYRIIGPMLGSDSGDNDERRVKALEQAGTLFCILLLLAGVSLIFLHVAAGR
jgi:hypothetical protein